MSSDGTVSAVIPNWNRAGLLAKVLTDLSHQTCPVRQVIVVDNGSTDASVSTAESFGVHVLQLPRNEGFAKAVNRGVEQSDSEWVLILNNDVQLERHWLETILRAVVASPEVFFAAGKLVSARDRSYLDGTHDAISRGATSWRCGHGCPDGPAWSKPRRINFAPLTATLVRRALFEEIGPLDEAFESYLEDVDFGLRCAIHRRTGIYVPDAVAAHEGSATLGAWHKATVRRISRNQTLLVRKYFRGAPLWPIVVGQLLWGILAVRHGLGVEWFRGKLEGLRMPVDPAPGGWDRLGEIVAESEQEIRNLYRQAESGLYWKLYFALVRN